MKLKLLLLAYILLLINGCQSTQSILISPISMEREDGTSIRYYLELRDPGSHSKNLLLFLQGSDCNSVRNMPLIEEIKAIYPIADIITIEKYGVTDSMPYSMDVRNTLPDGYPEFDNPQQRVSDAKKVMEAIIEKYRYENVLVFGGSEGATVAYMLASECNYVDATITLGGGGRFFIDDVVASIMASEGSVEENEKNAEEFRSFAQYILSQDNIPDLLMSEHGFEYWKIMLSYDQRKILNSIETPVLILQGGKDQAVSPEKTTEMVDELKLEGKRNIDYYFYPEYDHSLNFGTNEEAYKKVMSDIQKWVQKIFE